MRRRFMSGISRIVLISALIVTHAGILRAADKELVIREAEELRKNAVAVEAYLVDDILEAKISVRIFRARPKIHNVIVVGPKLGRISPIEIEQLFATTEEEPPYETKERGGFISFSDDTKTKSLKGTVVRKMFKFKIPPEKIVEDGHYQIWVKVKEEGHGRQGKMTSYKFDLEELPRLVKK